MNIVDFHYAGIFSIDGRQLALPMLACTQDFIRVASEPNYGRQICRSILIHAQLHAQRLGLLVYDCSWLILIIALAEASAFT